MTTFFTHVPKGLPLLWLLCLSFSPALIYGQGFTDVSEPSGLTVNHDGENATDFMPFSSGAAWLDYNKDGHLDLYVSMRTGANFLYHNNGDGTFTDMAETLGAADPNGDGGGVSIADVNNDGWPDIYLANADEDVLLRNDGGTSFTDISSGSGLDASGVSRTTSATWADYDGDGYLDLYVSQHVPTDMGASPDGTHHDFFFHNNGDETFTDVTSNLPASEIVGYGFIGGWTDFDKDGDMDIFLVNDCDLANPDPDIHTHTRLFRNDGGTDPEAWNFTEVAASVGIDDCRNGMGLAVGDFNRDGWPDYFYTNIGDCVLWQGDGDGTFTNVSASAGVDTQNPAHYSWGASFLDFDLDGWQDIIVAIGALAETSAANPKENQLFKNNGDGTFTDVAAAQGMNHIEKTRNIVYGDYDNDGDQDAFVVNYSESCFLMRNDNNTGNHYLKVELQGTISNRDGLGAKLNLTTPNGVTQYFETRSGSNLGGGDDIVAYFGLGNQTSVQKLEITWPSGTVQTINNITVDKLLSVVEPSGTKFEDVSDASGVNMIHDGYNIGGMEVGTGAAWFDYNNDGFLDLYVTMRTGSNALYKNNGDGTFTDNAAVLGVEDAAGDGSGVAIADFNNDGFQDIFLANCDEDRLFKNNGGTSFTDITAGSGLEVSGTARGNSGSWGDFDGDGYLDLFVSNHVPLDLNDPNATNQDFLFRNNGDETFSDVSASLGINPDLMGYGFIGGWTDYDNDGDLDILLVNDCLFSPPSSAPVITPTKLFRNDGGTDPLNWNFTEVSAAAGIDDCRNGMGLATGDYNRDGYMDHFYTNIGPTVAFKNNGDGTFSNDSEATGVGREDFSQWSWGTSFLDYDLDGWLDIIVAVGPIAVTSDSVPSPNLLYRNNGNATFTEIGESLGLNNPKKTRNAIYGDYDNDGDPDIFYLNYGEHCALMRNDVENGNHYLTVELEGTTSNRDGIGSKLRITTQDGTIQYFETRSGSNLGGGDAIDAYFGLADQTLITELQITWPSGTIQTVENIAADQKILVVENACESIAGETSRVISGENAVITWTENPTSIKYYLRYKQENFSTWKTITAPFARRFLNNLTPSTTYDYQVQNECDGGIKSSWTAIKQFTTSDDICDRPGSINLLNLNATQASINWEDFEDASKFQIRYRPVGGSWSKLASPNNSKVITGLMASTDYQVQIRAKCPLGWTNYSKSLNFTTPASAGGDSPQMRGSNGLDYGAVQLYPNPARDVLHINYSGVSPEDLILKSVNGQLMKIELNSPNQIDLSAFPPGIYFLSILTTDQQLITQKFIKH